MKRSANVFACSLIVLLTTHFALAQDALQGTVKPPKKEAAQLKEGWTFGADIGATLNWSVDRKFVGVADGHYASWGGKITGRALLLRNIHEWRNTLSWLETFNKIPQLDSIKKSADQLAFESLYRAHLGEWWGVFGQLKFNTSVFPGYDYRAAPVDYVITDVNQQQTTVAGTTSLYMTSPFQPFYLSESAGIFVEPLKYEYFFWEAHAGGTAFQTFTDGQRVITGDANGKVSVKTLSTFYQLGPSLGTSIRGGWMENKLSYQAGADATYVAWQWPYDADMSFAHRLNVEIFAGLSFKVYEWMGLTWDFRAIRIPAILDDFQVQSNVLLTFSYVL